MATPTVEAREFQASESHRKWKRASNDTPDDAQSETGENETQKDTPAQTRGTTNRPKTLYFVLKPVGGHHSPVQFCQLFEIIKKNGIDWVKDLGQQNNIQFMCMSSEMFPFASHAVHGYSLEYSAPLLARVGELGEEPGSQTYGPPGPVHTAWKLKAEDCSIATCPSFPDVNVLIILGGGMYDDKNATLGRIEKTTTELLSPGVRNLKRKAHRVYDSATLFDGY
ncbi:hypothetical protein B0H17DRAFT_1144648 [Mycena rosella]|uniref:Uncharacterized protein n=1 Tax=Mycena rosella TaxID=1033263 RepID=A0AAD7CT69_MYCRO|nr:hypothetical protein B0H17DRAFT_1144648 [Mycena rosella]